MPPGLSENNLTSNYTESYVSGEIQFNGRENSSTLRKLSQIGTMNLEGLHRKSVVLCGVSLIDDKGVGKCTEDNNIILLGTICLDDIKIKLEDLRKALCAEITTAPEGFVFVSKEGWPLLKKQESFLRANHVISDKNIISIKRHFEKEKLGIVLSGGNPLGFIFADVTSDLRQIRETIENQLKMSQQLKMEYRFVERNGWPVMQCQETLLSLMDIILGQVIFIQNNGKVIDQPSSVSRPTSMSIGYDTTPSDNRTPTIPDSQEGQVIRRKKSLKGILRPDTQQSMKGKKESQKRNKIIKDDLDLAQPILISYARAEAAQYALLLKQELVRRGYSVYLDVHEIKTGSDWQDSLNFAVTHCFLFVPLITRMYGKTQWTNREIKLADVLGKLIVPVNFGEEWPPACLAIQFASTQYIPWKLQENEPASKLEQEKAVDPRTWSTSQIERVAKLITDCYKDNCGPLPKRQLSIKEMVQSKQRPCTFSTPMKEDVYRTTSNPYDEAFEEKMHSIVISAHPKQRALVEELKELFQKEGNRVWSSCNWQESHDTLSFEDKNFSIPNTPRDLPTIAEGEVFFGQHDREVFYAATGENKKTTSCYKEPEAYGRRPLSRLMSQFSDISQPSTLNQEKLGRLRIFQQKVNEAGVVVVLVSEDFVKSTFSHQQIFYCEQRKRVVLVKCDESPVPKWFKLLMGNDMIMKSNNDKFECVLKSRIKRSLNPSSSETPKDATFEAKINYLVNYLKCNLPLQDTRVYITGSSKLQSPRSEEICIAVGRELSKMLNISVVTGGFFGVPDVTAKSFYEQRESSAQSYVEDSAVVHILPIHEAEDMKSKARQNLDGSFEVVPYGKTFFIGDSLKERETVVARLLDVCIVIEGGPGVVHEVEEFNWNDHFVIPIHSTGGAAGGQYGIPMKIFELPPGVDAVDWNVLSNPSASAEDVAKAVVNIIFSLKRAVSSPTATLRQPAFITRKNRKKLKKQRSQIKDERELDSHNSLNSELTADKIMKYKTEDTPIYYSQQKLVFRKQKWWQRLFGMFRKKRNHISI